MQFRIGDKVRFLNEVGSGQVVGFDRNNVVLVEDDDGFQIPMVATELVVVESSNEGAIVSVEQEVGGVIQLEKGSGVYLALQITPDNQLELNIINDTNYELHYAILGLENTDAKMILEGQLAANLKEVVGVFASSFLNIYRAILVQGMLTAKTKFKPVKPFQLEISKSKLLSGKKIENDFYDEKTNIISVLKDETAQINTAVKDLEQHWSQNENQSKSKEVSVKNKGIVELDLHMESLVDDHRGMSPSDMLKYQLEVFEKTLYAALADGKTRRLIAIHGVGNGRLKLEISQLLTDRFPNLSFQDASYQEYGFGATMIIIRS